jgi:hypothetical protein
MAVLRSTCSNALDRDVRRKGGRLLMSGRTRLRGGEPRKASQRNKRNISSVPARISPTWNAGDTVHWKNRAGTFRRDVGDGEHAEIVIGVRVYRVRTAELR